MGSSQGLAVQQRSGCGLYNTTSWLTDATVLDAGAPVWGTVIGEPSPAQKARLAELTEVQCTNPLHQIDMDWEALLSNPAGFVDYRARKASGDASTNHPDFKSVEGSIALWVAGRKTPLGIEARLAAVDSALFALPP